MRAELPELPDAKQQRFVEEYEVKKDDAAILTISRPVADYFEEAADTTGVIDIFSSFPIVVVVEYMDEEGTLLSMEQTSHYHFFLD